MHNSDLENLYVKINGHILLLGSYTQDNSIVKIIKSCRLKPYSIFTNDFHPGTRFEKHWVDEFGNSLKFKSTVPHIILGDLKLVDNTKISTDLFFGNSIKTISKNSKFAIIASGKHFDRDIFFAAFYGQDEYIRAFIFNKKWLRASPLLLGINTLHELFKNLNNPWITEIDKKRLDFVPWFEVDKCITTSLPTKQNITSCFEQEEILNII